MIWESILRSFTLQFNEVFRQHESKYRNFAVFASLWLGIIGIFLCFSIAAALLGAGIFISIPGSFFVRSYGVLAFLIPAFLFYAAMLLADPRYRPERIFVYIGLFFPFFTLALGFYWMREFEVLRLESVFIARAGKLGIGFFIFFLTALQLLAIVFLRYMLFSRSRRPEVENEPGLRAPVGEGEVIPPAPRSKAQSLRDIYAEAAAAMSGDETGTTVQAAAFAETEEPDEVLMMPAAMPAEEEFPEQFPLEGYSIDVKEAEEVSAEESSVEEASMEAG